MLDTKAAMALAEEAMKAKSKEEATEVKAEAKAGNQVAEDKDTPVATGTPGAETKPESQAPDTDRNTETAQPAETETRTEEKKPTYSKQERIDFAFQREKAKRKALQAKYDAAMKQLEELKARKPDQSNQTELVNYLVDVKDKERETKHIQESIQESQYLEYEELNNARIAECFPEKSEQDKFRTVISTEGPKLLKKLDEADPEQAVLAFLDDSDISPLLTRLLIAEPKYLDAVLAKRSPYGKYQAMKDLAERVEFARSKLNEQKGQDVSRETPKAKPAIPVVGSVTKSESTKETKQVFDPNAILAQLKSKNKYHK